MPPIIKMLDDRKLPRPRRRRLKNIVVLPTVLTLSNLVCGFSAIHFGMRAMYAAGAGVEATATPTLNSELLERMLPSFLSIGAMLIFVGMLMDMLDGLAARLTKKSSEFGAQLDSLADVVTFGAAPAILVVALMMREWRGEVAITPLGVHAFGRAMWVCAAAYCVCAAIRLARFNVEHVMPEFNQRRFRGLPSPGAAAVLASLVLLHEHVGPTVGDVLLYGIPFIALGLGFLMTSRISYNHLTQAYLGQRHPFEHVLILVLVFVVFLSYKAQTLAVLCGLYALSGPAGALIVRWRGNRDRSRPAPIAKAPGAENPRQIG